MRKSVLEVSEQVRHKHGCTTTEHGLTFYISTAAGVPGSRGLKFRM